MYSFLGRPFLLPRYVPLRLGFLEVMRQISMLQEIDFPPDKKGMFFPELIVFYHFVVTKGGRNELVHFLRPYYGGWFKKAK